MKFFQNSSRNSFKGSIWKFPRIYQVFSTIFEILPGIFPELFRRFILEFFQRNLTDFSGPLFEILTGMSVAYLLGFIQDIIQNFFLNLPGSSSRVYPANLPETLFLQILPKFPSGIFQVFFSRCLNGFFQIFRIFFYGFLPGYIPGIP